MIGLNILLVATGGAIGATARYGTFQLVKILAPTSHGWVPTILVNLIGSLLIGLISGWLLRDNVTTDSLQNSLTLLLMTGVLGGFTTFSTFSLDCYKLILQGEIAMFCLYTIISIVGGIVLSGIGLWLISEY